MIGRESVTRSPPGEVSYVLVRSRIISHAAAPGRTWPDKPERFGTFRYVSERFRSGFERAAQRAAGRAGGTQGRPFLGQHVRAGCTWFVSTYMHNLSRFVEFSRHSSDCLPGRAAYKHLAWKALGLYAVLLGAPNLFAKLLKGASQKDDKQLSRFTGLADVSVSGVLVGIVRE